MALAIRELGLSDELMVTELLDTFSPGWSNNLSPGASGPLAFLAANRTFITAAYSDNEPAGWVWGHHMWRPDGREMTYIHQVDVHPDHRRKGVAGMLVQSVIQTARSKGHHRVWLVTAQTNTAAQAFYDSIDGERQHGEGGNVVYMWRL